MLPAAGFVEARAGAAFRALLDSSSWVADEPWTPLVRDLSAPVEEFGLRIEYVDAQHLRDDILEDRIAVHRSAFPKTSLTLERWQTMAAGSPYRRGRCLVGYDADGRAITIAAAAALQELGSSSVTVCTPSSNVGGVAAYVSAGFEKLPDVTDFAHKS
ncbi:hypothetical protein [Kribbella sp. NPDC048928]|uniref:hypothetical protein n=1 Tax=Kribbella sp. NPDC048928 TaxID=3364111 RepID=UPI0037245F2C